MSGSLLASSRASDLPKPAAARSPGPSETARPAWRRAPRSIAGVAAAAGAEVGRGNVISAVDDALPGALFAAYREAGGVTR